MLILDACIVITFGGAGYFAVIEDLRLHQVCVAARVSNEVLRDPARAALHAALSSGRIAVVTVDLEDAAEQEALARFDARPAFRNRGEAEVLALAATRGFVIASDENAVRLAARKELGQNRVAGSLDLLKCSVQEGRISVHDAARILAKLDRGPAVMAALQRQGVDLIQLLS